VTYIKGGKGLLTRKIKSKNESSTKDKKFDNNFKENWAPTCLKESNSFVIGFILNKLAMTFWIFNFLGSTNLFEFKTQLV